MKIALVGPGLMPIPPKGWGAIESLIWKYYQLLEEQGHIVTIFNSQNLKEVVTTINEGNFDFVHVHYDEFARYFSRHCIQPFCITSHYGYILKPQRWAVGYFSIFVDFLSVPGIIALSPQIEALYKSNGFAGYTYVLRNGVDGKDFAYQEHGNGKVLCLGKIEPRKQQAVLAKILEGKVPVDFIGPIVDPEFEAGKTSQYKGVWTAEEVRQHLTEYSTLLLLSDGEAAPLVVIEALMAGLSVVISQSAAANLDEKEFITVLADNATESDKIVSALRVSVEKNDIFRKDIRNYALEKFDTPAIMNAYRAIITDFTQHKTFPRQNNSYKRRHGIKYYFSRTWLVLSRVDFLRRLKKGK